MPAYLFDGKWQGEEMSFNNSYDGKDTNGRSYIFISHNALPHTKFVSMDDVGSLDNISSGIYERTFVK